MAADQIRRKSHQDMKCPTKQDTQRILLFHDLNLIFGVGECLQTKFLASFILYRNQCCAKLRMQDPLTKMT